MTSTNTSRNAIRRYAKKHTCSSMNWRCNLIPKHGLIFLPQLHTCVCTTIYYHENLNHQNKWIMKSLIIEPFPQGEGRKAQGKDCSCRCRFLETLLFGLFKTYMSGSESRHMEILSHIAQCSLCLREAAPLVIQGTDHPFCTQELEEWMGEHPTEV
jgi:hypothetical protein